MRCPICGTDFYGGDGSCPGCGNYCGNDNNTQAGYTNARPVYNMPVYRQAPQQYTQKFKYFDPNSVDQAKVKKFAVIVLVICLVVIGVIVVMLASAVSTNNYDFGFFSMDLPGNMKQTKDTDIAAVFQNGSYDCGVYENSAVRFAYVVSDTYKGEYGTGDGDKEQYEKLNSQLYIETIAASFKARDKYDYKELEKSEDSLVFTYKDTNNTDGYCHLKIIPNNDRWYIFFLFCNEARQKTYSSRFDKWLDTIAFK